MKEINPGGYEKRMAAFQSNQRMIHCCLIRKFGEQKIPLKIKIFLWLIQQGAILTKDNLSRKIKWEGDKKCAFCNEESIQHIFFDCRVIKYVWSLIALTIGAKCRPASAEQYMV
jgi:hypothetical protein